MPSRRNPLPRAYVAAGGFTVSLGPINLLGCLIPVVATGAKEHNEYTSICPECEIPTQPKQGYTCENGHGPYPLKELLRARNTDDGLVPVSNDEVTEARKSDLDLNVCRVSVHPADQVDRLTRPTGQGYVFIPDIQSREHDLLLALALSDRALIAAANIKHHEGLFRLEAWNGHLVLQRVLWPHELNKFEEHTIDIDTTLVDAGMGMLDRLSEDFDPETYIATTKLKLEALNASVEGSDVAPRTSSPRRDDLLEVLAAFG